MKLIVTTLMVIFIGLNAPISAQNNENVINSLFLNSLNDTTTYHQLRYLTKTIGGRLTGSPQAMAAVEYFYEQLKQMGFDTVYLQETKVPHWVRGEKETARIVSTKYGREDVNVCALGTSIGTGNNGIVANVVEVHSMEELAKLGIKNIKGKLVFFNHPADPNTYATFSSYGSSVWQRSNGAAEAAKFGAIGVIVRSATLAHDYFPHTGVMRYQEGIEKIPAVAISTNDADLLSSRLKAEPQLNFFFKTTCEQFADVKSYNVIAEIKGSKSPNEVFVVGGHLDSWDTGEGANDDGIGVAQSIEVLRLFMALNLKPAHTIRAILYMDEEVGQSGGSTYAELAKTSGEKNLFALESDRGAGLPLGFSFEAPDELIKKVQSWQDFFLRWGLYSFTKGGSGVDVEPLKELGVPLAGLVTNSQEYFDYHHSPNDVFEHVNYRELQLGGASMAALLYLLDLNWVE
jgi:acetylornithine deacetylase/succinyl-diaminopimelate desuccinylase-like protein